jgi:hypothetical protein
MTDETEFDPKQRRLCPDGSCVGLIGPEGLCTECGRAAGPATGTGGIAREADVALDEDARTGVSPEASDSPEAFNPGRRLCDDGSCVGVVGEGGRCSVCGRAWG